MDDALKEIRFLTVIAGRKQKEPLVTALTQHGGHMVDVIYGKGSVKASHLMDALGLVPEEKKVMLTCLLTRKRAEETMQMLRDKFHFDLPNTGIAFTVPVNKLSF